MNEKWVTPKGKRQQEITWRNTINRRVWWLKKRSLGPLQDCIDLFSV